MNKSLMKPRIVALCITIAILVPRNKIIAQDSLTFKLAYIAIKQDRKPTGIDDAVPDIKLDKIVNYSAPGANISDFKGKFLILHFWHQYCANCVAAFTKLQSLQHEFSDKLVILPVTFQSEASVQDFFAQQKRLGKPISLPSVVEDTLLRKIFPHDGDPHEIIINEDGVVVAITEVTALTIKNINDLVSNKKVQLEEKKNDFNFNPQAPFLVNHNGGDDGSFIYRSLITKYIDSINSRGFRMQQDSAMTRLFLANASLIELYKSAYSYYDTSVLKDLQMDYMNKKVLIQSGDSEKFRDLFSLRNADYDTQLTFKRKYLYSYELILPPSFTLNKSAGIMIQDLDRFFNVESSVKRTKLTCLALVRKGETDKIATKSKETKDFLSEDNLSVGIQHMPISSLAQLLNMYFDLPLIVDETGYSGNADLLLEFNGPCNITVLREQLARFNLDVKEKKYFINMLVLKDREHGIR